jgi:hypothetical protein
VETLECLRGQFHISTGKKWGGDKEANPVNLETLSSGGESMPDLVQHDCDEDREGDGGRL